MKKIKMKIVVYVRLEKSVLRVSELSILSSRIADTFIETSSESP